MKKLLFGTSGIPLSVSGSGTVKGIERVRELGLGAMELAFTRGVRMDSELAKEVNEAAKKNNIILTAHAPYYVNLNSKEDIKIKSSIARIVKTIKIAKIAGAVSVVFHAGYYMDGEPEEVYVKIKEGIDKILKELKNLGIKEILVRPETMGKERSWGSFEEVIKMSGEFDEVLPCLDISHVYTRSLGKINTYVQFIELLGNIEKKLGKKALKNMHIHCSGIEFGEKGEKWHLPLKDSKFNYKDFLKAVKNFECCGVIICESPNKEEDTLILKKYYDSL